MMKTVSVAALCSAWLPLLLGVGSVGFAVGTTYGVAAMLIAAKMEKEKTDDHT